MFSTKFFRHKAWFFLIFIAVLLVVYLNYPLPHISDENLQKFYGLTQSVPLFYDPATDEVFLRESVSEMKRTDELILYVDRMLREQGDHKNRDIFPAGWRLWPDEFLAVLPDIHVETTGFLKDPSKERALALSALYERAAVLYKKSADLNFQAVNNALKQNPNALKNQIIFLGSGTTPEIVRDDFVLIQKNGAALLEEIKNRRKCLYRGNCSFKVKSDRFRDTSITSVKILYDPLPAEILNLGKDTKTPGPYWAETPCFGLNSGGQTLNYPFYLIEKKSKSGRVWLKPKLTNEKYYRDHEAYPDEAVARVALPKGIKFLPHYETNDYLCSDLRYIPELVYQHLEKVSGVKDTLSRLSKISTLPHVIQNTLSFSYAVIAGPLIMQKAYTPIYFLTNRSAYSLYFGTFSPMIWRIEERPKFLLEKNLKLKPGYVTYHDLLSGPLSYEDILKLNSLPNVGALLRD